LPLKWKKEKEFEDCFEQQKFYDPSSKRKQIEIFRRFEGVRDYL